MFSRSSSFATVPSPFALLARTASLLTVALLLLLLCGLPPALAQDVAEAPQEQPATSAEESAAAAEEEAEDGSNGNAQQQDTGPMTVGMQGGRFGVGLASSWPAYGISGTLQFSETLTAEAVLGFFGTVSNFSARGWYRFNRTEKYDLYGYAAAGVYRYDYSTFLANDTENVLGLGAGAGVEASLGKLLDEEDFPPIFLNSEVGIAYANFDFYNFSALSFGVGIHYRFGGD